MATFEISNIEDEVSTLRGKGVNFEGYDMQEIKTQNGIARQGSVKAAWFKDSEETFFVFTRQSNRRICEDGLEKTHIKISSISLFIVLY